MATINGIISNEKSMSGVVESPIGDIIECTTLIADSVESQNIYAQDGTQPCSLFNNDYDTITLGNSATNLMNLGAFQFLIDTIRHITSTLNLYLFPTTTGVINFATSASQILFGSSTALTSAFVPTANNHLTNKLYVDSVVGSNLLTSNNTFTGTNTFSTPTNTPSFKIDNTGGAVELDFLTNSSNVNQKTGKIIASATGGVNSTALSYYGNDHTFYGELYQLISNLYPVRWGVYTGGTSIALKFNTNTSSFGTTTNTITASGGTNPNTGTLTLSGISSFNSNTNTQSVKINPLSSGSATLEFYTNTSSSTQRSSYINGSGGTSADAGNLTIQSGTLTMNTATSFPNNSQINYNYSSGTLVEYNGDNPIQIISTAITYTPDPRVQQQDTTYWIAYDAPNGVIMNIAGNNGVQFRCGFRFKIFNHSAFGVTIKNINGSTFLYFFGNPFARSGTGQFTLASNTSMMFQMVTLTTAVNGYTNVIWCSSVI